MSPRWRINVALIVLLALVIGVWLTRQAISEQHPDDRPGIVHLHP